MDESRPWLLAGAGGLVAGGIHMAVAPEHFAEANGLGLFFFAMAAVQIVWCLWHLARPSLLAWLAGITIATAALLTYVAALTLEAPFTDGLERMDYQGLSAKVVELATLLLLAVPLLMRPAAVRRGRTRVTAFVAAALLAGLAGAAAAFGAGYAAEAVAPSLSEAGGHGHGGEQEAGHNESQPAEAGPGAALPLSSATAGYRRTSDGAEAPRSDPT